MGSVVGATLVGGVDDAGMSVGVVVGTAMGASVGKVFCESAVGGDVRTSSQRSPPNPCGHKHTCP